MSIIIDSLDFLNVLLNVTYFGPALCEKVPQQGILHSRCDETAPAQHSGKQRALYNNQWTSTRGKYCRETHTVWVFLPRCSRWVFQTLPIDSDGTTLEAAILWGEPAVPVQVQSLVLSTKHLRQWEPQMFCFSAAGGKRQIAVEPVQRLNAKTWMSRWPDSQPWRLLCPR